MNDRLWNQVRAQLLLDLKAAHKAHAFDYDAAIEKTRVDEIASITRTNDAPEYDRQWAVSLHTLAGIVYVIPMMISMMALVAAL